MSIIMAILLIGDPSTDTALPGIQAEAASDSFAACFEPKLADDPVIKTPLATKVPFESLDNDISNAAFRACVNFLSDATGPRRIEGSDQKQLDGMRLIAARSSFYSTRGQLNLNVRRQIRPYLACIEKSLASAERPKSRLDEAVPVIVTRAKDDCHLQKPEVEFTGSEDERAIQGRLLARYFDGFAQDILAFRFKVPLKKKS